MAFPFSMFNIAHLAAGFKSQTHVFRNAIAKAVCCPHILLSGVHLKYPLPKHRAAIVRNLYFSVRVEIVTTFQTQLIISLEFGAGQQGKVYCLPDMGICR